jgi:hypothetical protein
MDKHTTKLAIHIFNWYAKQWASYEVECEEYSKQGYRPYACFHGTRLWTDYDPMCGMCEDGYGWFDPMLYRQLAISQAKQAFKEFNERLEIYTKATTAHAPLDHGKMITWVSDPLNQWGAWSQNAKQAVALAPTF